ncbi:MAG: ATP-binding protein [Cyanobacteria bacterium J06639_14]
MESAVDGMAILEDGKYIYLNTTHASLFGYEIHELMGQSWETLYTPIEVKRLKSVAFPVLAQTGHWSGENTALRKDGSTFAQEVSLSLMANSKLICICRDISYRKQADAAILQKSQDLEKALAELQNAQLQLIKSEKMSALGGLVAGVAHEINNPTSCIIGNVDVAQDYFSDLLGLLECYGEQFPQPGADIEQELKAIDLEYVREDMPKLIRAMRDAGNRIQSISRSLRTFSRVDKATKQPFDIREGIESTLLILRHRLKANEHRPAIAVEANYGDIPEIHCFPGQLNQVFMNMLANAIDMFDEMAQQMTFKELEKTPQQITIHTAQLTEQGVIAIQIADNGRGIPDEVKSKIFDHLFTTKGVGKGTGLGLAIARQIVVDAHRGSLDVRSEVGQGTEFCIRLPL